MPAPLPEAFRLEGKGKRKREGRGREREGERERRVSKEGGIEKKVRYVNESGKWEWEC